jgi:hypothetical protein
LIIAIVAVALSSFVGTSGGEIRHTEIRANATPTVGMEQGEAKDKD